MYPEERQQAIAHLAAQRGRVSVADLAAQFEVTTETVRRDLNALEQLGVVRRVHGGVVPASALSAVETQVDDRDVAHPEQKDAIARAALAMLPPAGGTLLLDAGTTTARLARLLPVDQPRTVITHAVPIAAILTTNPAIDLHLLPGRVRTTTQAAVGVDTVTALGDLRVDVAVIGTNGLSRSHGLSTPDRDEAAVKRALVGAADRVVVVADSSKLDVEATVRFAGLDQIDVLVTDDGLTATQRQWLTDAEISVVIR
ncbi:DeoR/GlpR family DNA-binding transcription regulator [Nocardioides limicola]|uniref:DeoR/GlpR family DNA-binding transcription regulator n=1 Tax=Nocardioides limicola TaxID=2803368 RepID=UPI00193B2F78|nr:DeoR/GlpR family DNA-binding transcription regulator [Nocardioides sp. DJM-14]